MQLTQEASTAEGWGQSGPGLSLCKGRVVGQYQTHSGQRQLAT